MTSEQITALAALVVALVSMATGVWQARATRIHNRLSVQPRLVIRWHSGGSHGILGLTVANEGLGPAVVTRSVFRFDGKEQEWSDVLDNLTVEFNKLELPDYLRFTDVVQGTVIRSGDRLWVFSTEASDDAVDRFPPLSNRVRLRIWYESMYHEKYVEPLEEKTE